MQRISFFILIDNVAKKSVVIINKSSKIIIFILPDIIMKGMQIVAIELHNIYFTFYFAL